MEEGWSQLATGRFEKVADDDLDDFIGQLGARSTEHGAWLMVRYRLTHAAQSDVVSILVWSEEHAAPKRANGTEH
jgi:hypothetical protein